jgi:MFS family permease
MTKAGAASRRPSAYLRFWSASAVSIVGSSFSALALQVLAVRTLHASPVGLGLLNAARYLPYLLFGLVAGVVADRYRRRPILVAGDLGRAAVLALIAALAFGRWLSLPVLVVLVALIGLCSVFFDAADQAYLPTLVPAERLTAAIARLEQADAAGQSIGPLLAGLLVRAAGAAVAVLADAVSYLISGLVLAGLRAPERPPPATPRHLLSELREGVRWVYRHRMLAPLAVSDHLWFLANSLLGTVLVLYVLDGLRGGAVTLGVVQAAAGAGAILGGGLAARAGRRFGAGPVLVAARLVNALPWLLVVAARPGPAGWILVAAGQLLYWIPLGVEGPNELAYRQSVTPERLRGRMSITIRSLNRGAVVLGAPLGGLLAGAAGYRAALWCGLAGLVVSAAVLLASPFRRAGAAVSPPTG